MGKTTIARILAKSLNCVTNGVTATPCGTCAACIDIDAGRFVDLLELDAASNTGIDNMRDILDNARYAPTVGRYKVYLIDEVHMLSKAAFNSMLKTLEEPPEHVKFVLATTDPQKIPVTVLSRCLQFNLKPLPPHLIGGRIDAILAAEGIALRAGGVALIARAARGSLRDGLSLLDQAIAYGGGEVREGGRAHDAGRGRPRVRLPHRRGAGGGRRHGAARGGRCARRARALGRRRRSTNSRRCSIASRSRRSCRPPPRISTTRERVAAFAARILRPRPCSSPTRSAPRAGPTSRSRPTRRSGFAMTLLRLLAFEPAAGRRPRRAAAAGASRPCRRVAAGHAAPPAAAAACARRRAGGQRRATVTPVPVAAGPRERCADRGARAAAAGRPCGVAGLRPCAAS